MHLLGGGSFLKFISDAIPDFSKTKYIKSTIIKKEQQKTIFRFNCADSLDRTNMAMFFFTLHITRGVLDYFNGKDELNRIFKKNLDYF